MGVYYHSYVAGSGQPARQLAQLKFFIGLKHFKIRIMFLPQCAHVMLKCVTLLFLQVWFCTR